MLKVGGKIKNTRQMENGISIRYIKFNQHVYQTIKTEKGRKFFTGLQKTFDLPVI